MDINSIPCPWEFTGNACVEFSALFVAAYQWAVWARDFYANDDGTPAPEFQLHGFPSGGFSGPKPDFARNQPMPSDHTADGITLWCHGWQAEAYGEFVDHVLRKLPTAYPDGDLEINIGGDINKPLLHLWHD